MRGVKALVRNLFLLSLSVLMFFACRTARLTSELNLKPISTGRLIKGIEENAVDYEYLSIKRINCNFEDNNNRATFRANLKALKDEKIILSFNKLNIPVGRILLMPDTVKYINYINKNYFISDYSFLEDFLNMNIDFYDVQSILSNSVFSYRNDPADRDFRNFTTYIDSGRYVLQSVNNRKLDKIEQKDKEQKADRILRRLGDQALILQTLFINPGNFNIEKLEIEDKTNSQGVKILFGGYKALNNKDYPGSINMIFSSDTKKITMDIKLGGISTDEISSFRFNIPSKYERVVLN